MVSFVNKYKISLEPAKHINDRVVKLLDQTVEARESNKKIELGVRKSRAMETSLAKIIQSRTITTSCTTKITNQITITTFCTAKTTDQITITGFCMYLIRAIAD